MTIDTLRNKIREYSTKQIIDALNTIGGNRVDVDKTIVRAALLDVYEERKGGDAVDALMTNLGML